MLKNYSIGFIFALVITILLSCSRNESSLPFQLVGAVKANEQSNLCSKFVFAIINNSWKKGIEKDFSITLPELPSGDSLCYLANGRLTKIVYYVDSIHEESGTKWYRGYFLFSKGKNDTLFLYKTIYLPVQAIRENDFYYDDTRYSINSIQNKEISESEWQMVIKEKQKHCFDSVFGIIINRN